MRGITLVTVSLFGFVIGCAGGGEATTGDPNTKGNLGSTVADASPCDNPSPDVLICEDFDGAKISDAWTPTTMGGGLLAQTAQNSRSSPNSLHVKTVSGDDAAAALVLHKAVNASRIAIDVDAFIVSTTTTSVQGSPGSSLLRVNLMTQDAAVGSYYLHYAPDMGVVQIVSVADDGTESSHSLGDVPNGWFHISLFITPAVGGGTYLQAQIDDRALEMVAIAGDQTTDFGYSFEAGLNVPAADNYEAFIDNVIVRKR